MSGPCPKCGSELAVGYGLAGGGIGPYVYCTNEKCDHFEKSQDLEAHEPPASPKDNHDRD